MNALRQSAHEKNQSQALASQQIDEIKNLYRTYKNIGLNIQEGTTTTSAHHHVEFDAADPLSQTMLPTIKVSEIHKTTTTFLPPLP